MYARNYTKYSDEEFCENKKDVNLLAGDFIPKLDSSTNWIAPMEMLKSKQIKLRLKPWITYDIQN